MAPASKVRKMRLDGGDPKRSLLRRRRDNERRLQRRMKEVR